MQGNDIDISLLQDDPEKLLIRYQPIIRIIVRNLAFQGCLSKRNINDLVQEVNSKLIERLPKICQSYNYKSQFKTYFSVVVRNLCLEEIRKVRLVEEPQAEVYEQSTTGSLTDQMVINQEYERLQRALRMFGKECASLRIVLRSFADLPVTPEDFNGFVPEVDAETRDRLTLQLNETLQKQKQEKLEVLSLILNQVEPKARTADALRKWASSRLDELVNLMNGNPPRSAYTIDILYILLEKTEFSENN